MAKKKTTTKKKAAKKKTTRKKAAAKKPTLVEADPDREPRAYATTEHFLEGDTVDHPAFGRGVVQEVPRPGKVRIHFGEEGGMKLLIQGK